MTCGTCGMSVDSRAGERQEAVRGRVREKPEIEIDEALPRRRSTFPFVPALGALVVVLGGIVAFAMYRSRPEDPVDTHDLTLREKKQQFATLQRAFDELWATAPKAAEIAECRELRDLVHRPCDPAVNLAELAFDQAVLGLAEPTAASCQRATSAFAASRVAAKCE